MRLLLAFVLVTSACEKDKPAKPVDPACSDAEIKKRMDSAFAVIKTYFGEIERRLPAWQDCAAATQGFTELEPMANAYMAEVVKVKDWSASIDAACKERVKQHGETTAEAKQVAARFDPLEDKVKAVLQRCEDHPGFKEAVAKGLRVMKKKQ